MSDAYLGEIRMFAGNFAPKGWALCNGTELPVKGNDALFSLIGSTYGGDGRNTFKLPDYRGRTPVGQGSGPGLSSWSLAERAGVEQITLTAENTPPHIHGFQVSANEAASAVPVAITPPINSLSFGKFKRVSPTDSVTGLYSKGTNNSTMVSLNPSFLSPALGVANKSVAPHSNMMGSLVINYIICMTGLYPSKP
ncbi:MULTISPECIES: phage tail protein [Pseudomonas]|uniref:Phage tail collar domain-containing protein n=1 Tax=Pseudomonas protegens (strain DSM 19095 / LMG 27888 / CFBP 6595 / CHA0) TaxID=1124983 RepID=A0A2C9ENT0_PSEPH|nr:MULTISPECIES: tail fiber protein [Pseudomonas]AGL85326.1 hypothetical protein PFLCHA0_c35580 [Pseudomonas protegens CHA0]APC21483.1 hypothetical protein BME99_18450 [Pseudomonas protegens]MBB1616510.1 hypothetical protein [Pseudomonas sp. UMC65]MBB1618010.1 hypothetical protein [Pseudomonas sp. UME65]MBF0641979.1 phage tail protein [Pseudomonas protegens]